jgi:hypothetical protein
VLNHTTGLYGYITRPRGADDYDIAWRAVGFGVIAFAAQWLKVANKLRALDEAIEHT